MQLKAMQLIPNENDPTAVETYVSEAGLALPLQTVDFLFACERVGEWTFLQYLFECFGDNLAVGLEKYNSLESFRKGVESL